MKKLRRKTVIVFGGTGGIGEGAVRSFFEAGDNVVVVARNLKNLAGLKSQFGGPNNMVALSADAGNPDTVDKVFFEAKAKFGRVDGVFISVGTWDQNFPTTPPEELKASRQRLKKSLVDTVKNICSSAAKTFDINFGGIIFHISSHVAERDEDELPGNVVYREKKLEAEKIANSFANRKIRVVNLRPAIVNTPKNEEVLTKGGKDMRESAVSPKEIGNWCVKHFDDLELPTSVLFDSTIVV